MKESTVAYIATVAMLASGLMFAQSSSQGTMDSQVGSSTASAPQTGGHTDVQGDLPASKEAEAQSGKASQASPKSERPGSMGAAKTSNQGTTPKGETPATGVQTGQEGSSSVDPSVRPGIDPNATKTSSYPTEVKKHKHAKRSHSSDSSTSGSTPTEKSTDSGTASPK